jgi:hypothetical protein
LASYMCALVLSVLTILNAFDIYKLLPSLRRAIDYGWQCPTITFITFWLPLFTIYDYLLPFIVAAGYITAWTLSIIWGADSIRMFRGHRARFRTPSRHTKDHAIRSRRALWSSVILWCGTMAHEVTTSAAVRSPNPAREWRRQGRSAIARQRSIQAKSDQLYMVSSKCIDRPDKVQRQADRVIHAAVAMQASRNIEHGPAQFDSDSFVIAVGQYSGLLRPTMAQNTHTPFQMSTTTRQHPTVFCHHNTWHKRTTTTTPNQRGRGAARTASRLCSCGTNDKPGARYRSIQPQTSG